MIGDATLFQSADNIETGWHVVQPILDAWQSGQGGAIAPYAADGIGPEEADAFRARDGRRWRVLDEPGEGKAS